MKTLKSVCLIALSALLFSCNKNADELLESSLGENIAQSTYTPGELINGILCHPEEPFIMYCSEEVYPLCYNNNNIGTVTVKTSSEGKTYVTYKTTGQWYLKELYLFTGDVQAIPCTVSGTMLPDLFPNIKIFNSGVREHTFIVSNMPTSFNVAANAEVVKHSSGGNVLEQQTAWGGACSQ